MHARDYRFDMLRLLAAFAVVTLHMAALFVTKTPDTSGTWLVGNYTDSAVRWCVPFFVIITGALLFPKLIEGQSTRDYYRRRSGLLIPAAFWIGFYILYQWLIKKPLLGEPYGSAEMTHQLLTGQPYYHLWYFYMIIPLLALAPLLARLLKRLTIRSVHILIVLLFAISAIIHVQQVIGALPATPAGFLWLEFLGYFLCGYVYMQQSPSVSSWRLAAYAGAALVMILCIAELNAVFCMYENGEYCSRYPFYEYHSAPVIILSLTLFKLLYGSLSNKTNPLLNRLAPLAFGVYLIHPLWIDLLLYVWQPYWQEMSIVWLFLWVGLVSIASLFSAGLLYRIPFLRRLVTVS